MVQVKKQSQKITIHQFHPNAAPGDAITNQMKFIQQSLAAEGIEGKVFAHERAGDTSTWVRPFEKTEAWEADLLLIHHSQFNPFLPQLLKLEIPKALIYHNITPAQFFQHDPFVNQLCRRGREQIRQFKNNVVAIFADSHYNAEELEDVGLSPVQILPLFDLPSRLKKNSEGRKRKTGAPRLLFVGRMAPHKNQARIIETLYFLKKIHPDASLTLVGSEEPVYGKYLRDLVTVLELESSVRFTGKVTDAELRDLYLSASAFVCLSLHEGFCIPLVEAMSYGLPIFSSTGAALSETLGDAGVQLKTDEPLKIALILATTLNDSAALQTVLDSQQSRLTQWAETENKEKLVETLRETVNRMRHLPPHGSALPERRWFRIPGSKKGPENFRPTL